MPLEVDGEIYVTASEAAKELDISRETFYNNVQPQLQPYKFGVFKRTYYRKSDLNQFRGVRPFEKNGNRE